MRARILLIYLLNCSALFSQPNSSKHLKEYSDKICNLFQKSECKVSKENIQIVMVLAMYNKDILNKPNESEFIKTLSTAIENTTINNLNLFTAFIFNDYYERIATSNGRQVYCNNYVNSKFDSALYKKLFEYKIMHLYYLNNTPFGTYFVIIDNKVRVFTRQNDLFMDLTYNEYMDKVKVHKGVYLLIE